MRSAPRSAWMVAAVLAAVVAVVEAPVLLGGRTWADRGYQTEVLPARAAAADAWASGRLPEWWDASGFGVPLAAEPSHGAMYPVLAMVGAAPDAAPAMDLVLVLHAMLAAIGVALWARRRGAGDLAAVVAGGAIAASGALHAALLAGGLGVAWLPWVGWAADEPASADDADDAAALGLVAHRARIRRAVATAATIGAAGLATPAMLVDAVLVAVAVGAARGRTAAAWAVVAAALGALACAVAWLPAVVHRMGDVAATGALRPRGAEVLGWLAPAGDARMHLGAAWLALAALAVVERRAIAPAVAALACGALAWLPAFAWGDPTAHVAAASIVVVVLGAAALDRLADAVDARAMVALGAAAVVVAGALAARHAGVVASLGELAAIAALALAWPRGGRFQLGAAVLAIAPALLGLRTAAPLVARSALAERPLLAPPAGERVYRPRAMDPDDPDVARRAEDDHATVAGDVAARFGAATAQTPDPGRRDAEDAVWKAAGMAGGQQFDRFGIETAILPATVVQAMQAVPLATRGRWSLTDVHAKRPRAFVAARTRGARTPADELAEAAPSLDVHGTPLDTVVIAGASDDAAPAALIAPCTRRVVTPEDVEVACAHAPTGWAVIEDAWAPGWSATVDGDDAEVRRADALVRAVRIDAGDRTIAWRYRAPWLRVALIVSGLAWVHLAFAAWLARRRRAPAAT